MIDDHRVWTLAARDATIVEAGVTAMYLEENKIPQIFVFYNN
jgi:hypothetical protein